MERKGKERQTCLRFGRWGKLLHACDGGEGHASLKRGALLNNLKEESFRDLRREKRDPVVVPDLQEIPWVKSGVAQRTGVWWDREKSAGQKKQKKAAGGKRLIEEGKGLQIIEIGMAFTPREWGGRAI